jgi:hypothetical protein
MRAIGSAATLMKGRSPGRIGGLATHTPIYPMRHGRALAFT